jgi:nucleoid-associated protein YgaU
MKNFKLFSLFVALSAGTVNADEAFVVLEYRSMQHGSSGSGGYYRVQRGDTLAKIVARHYNDPGNRDELFREIVAANPRAFVGSDPDRLLSGSVLNIPKSGSSSGGRRDDIYFF